MSTVQFEAGPMEPVYVDDVQIDDDYEDDGRGVGDLGGAYYNDDALSIGGLTTDAIEGAELAEKGMKAAEMHQRHLEKMEEIKEKNRVAIEKETANKISKKAAELTKEKEEELCENLRKRYDDYLKTFPEHCSKRKLSGRESRQELERLLKDVKGNLDRTNAYQTCKDTFCYMAKGAELIGPMFKLQLAGPVASFSTTIERNIDLFDQEIKELIIEYAWLFQRPLLWRVAQGLVMCAVKVHMVNQAALSGRMGNNATADQPLTEQEAEVVSHKKDKYKDL